MPQRQRCCEVSTHSLQLSKIPIVSISQQLQSPLVHGLTGMFQNGEQVKHSTKRRGKRQLEHFYRIDVVATRFVTASCHLLIAEITLSKLLISLRYGLFLLSSQSSIYAIS